MTVRSRDAAKDIAIIALRQNSRFDGDILEEVLAYCWDQLCWIRNSEELVGIRDRLSLDDDDTAPSPGGETFARETCPRCGLVVAESHNPGCPSGEGA